MIFFQEKLVPTNLISIKAISNIIKFYETLTSGESFDIGFASCWLRDVL